MAFIRIEQLAKHFKGTLKPAVDGFQLDIEHGEIISLLGPSVVVVEKRRL
jgi:ABC-type Fe3+/spermidine/putrescine transport system ATPase subunit